MKRLLLILFAIIMIAPCACKKGEDSKSEISSSKRYAKYRVNIYKDKELKTWMATLEKAEDVIPLADEKYQTSEGKTKEISRIKLTDDSIGYIETRHLADKPIVFTSDTKAFVRPTIGSKLYATIPKGELGFIIGEKDEWVQIYVGEVNNRRITQQWVNGGYSTDALLVLQAKEYASAVSSFDDKDEEKKTLAKETLENLSNGNSVISELAKEKLMGTENTDINTEEPAMDTMDENTYNEADDNMYAE